MRYIQIGFAGKILIASFLMFLLSFWLPIINFSVSDSFLTAATFLFGILYGFEISVVIANFVSLKTQLAIENSGILSIFHLADILGGDTGNKIKNKIEKYLLVAIDYPLVRHLETDKEFFDIFEPLKSFRNTNNAAKNQALQYLNEGLYYIPQARNQINDVAPRFVKKTDWTILALLGLFLITALFLNRQPDTLSRITAATFSTTIVGALLLLDEIDSNEIMEGYLEYGMFNETLKSIGKMKYYPEFAIKSGVVTSPSKEKYRIGIFPKYPSLEERQIKIRG